MVGVLLTKKCIHNLKVLSYVLFSGNQDFKPGGSILSNSKNSSKEG